MESAVLAQLVGNVLKMHGECRKFESACRTL